MAFNHLASLNDAALMAAFGEPVTVAGQPLTAVIDRGVEIVGDYGQVAERRTQLSVQKSLAAPVEARGVAVQVTGPNGVENYVTDGVEFDDGLVVKVWLR